MTIRNTATLPATNDYKPAINAGMALAILADRLERIAKIARAISAEDIPEEDYEAVLTLARGRVNNQLTELDAWRAL